MKDGSGVLSATTEEVIGVGPECGPNFSGPRKEADGGSGLKGDTKNFPDELVKTNGPKGQGALYGSNRVSPNHGSTAAVQIEK